MEDQILDQPFERTFKTKTGYCHVTADKIILSREGVRGNLAKVTTGNRVSYVAIFYSLMSVWILYSAYEYYLKGSMFMAVFYGLLGAYVLFGAISTLNYSMAPVIERKDIRSVKYVKGVIGLTRSRFVIDFDERGRKKKRMILMSGIFTGNVEEGKALQIMQDEGLCK